MPLLALFFVINSSNETPFSFAGILVLYTLVVLVLLQEPKKLGGYVHLFGRSWVLPSLEARTNVDVSER